MTIAERWQSVKRGERPLVPAVAALAAIWLGFGIASPSFLSAENLVNLSLQSVSIGIIALGSVLTLLAGQIDLSVGSVSGLAAAIVAAGSVTAGWPLAVTVLVALLVGVAAGLFYGVLVARAGIPGFVLTLAGLLVIAGLQWRVLGRAGSINLPLDSWLVRFSQAWFLPTWVALAGVAGVAALLAATGVRERSLRLRAGLPSSSLGQIALRAAALLVLGGGGVLYLGQARGMGASVLLFLALVVAVDVLLRRTVWGRAMRATGGDIRTARLAGVPVRRITVSAFAACSGLAALGGVLAAGRLAAANQSTGGGELFLMAIAAAVIGGTSLYGGRGSAWSALIGVLVIQSIANGLTLLDLDAAARSITTGAVLALAVTIDTLLRRRRTRAPS
jgi:ABC-type xylose transport system permease subunit